MSRNKRIVLWLISFLLAASAAAAPRRVPRHPAALHQGDLLLTPEIVFVYHTTSLGGNLEYMLKPNLSLGGDLLLFLEGSGGMIVSPDIAFHFPVNVEKLDVYAGAGPALAFGFGGGESEFGFKPFGGARYYFSPKLAAYFKLLAFIGSGSSFGGAFGVTLRP